MTFHNTPQGGIAESAVPTVNGVHLHSSYNPRREARRYAERVHPESDTPRIIVIGEGFPFFSEELRARFRSARVLSLLLAPPPEGANGDATDITHIDESTLRRWVRERIPPLHTRHLHVEVWPAAHRVAPELVEKARAAIVGAVEDLQSHLATIGSFGRRWIGNALTNALCYRSRWEVSLPPRRVLAVTSGWSAGEQRALIKRLANDVPLIATSSAYNLLRATGVQPRIIVHTDGGYWAGRYLSETPPSQNTASPLLALPAHAATPIQRARPHALASRPLFLSSETLSEQLHIDHDLWPRVHEQPTVTATMIETITSFAPSAHLTLIGADLCSYALYGHVREHLHDALITRHDSRLNTEWTQRAKRIWKGRSSRYTWRDGTPAYHSASFSAFRAALLSTITHHRKSGEVELVGSSPVWEQTLPLLPQQEENQLRNREPWKEHEIFRPSRAARYAHAHAVLNSWYETVATSSDATGQEIALHLAAAEVLRYERGEIPWYRVAKTARAELTQLLQLASHHLE